MNKGFRSWARPRHKVYVSEPVAINTSAGNKFYHGFGRVPRIVEPVLQCVTANNGFQKGDEMPLTILFRHAGGDSDGIPYWYERRTAQYIDVWISASDIRMQTTSLGSGVAFVAAEWKLVMVCRDVERLT